MSELTINQSDHEGIQILELEGRLVFGDSELSFRAAIARLQDAKEVNVILDLKDTKEIDLDGLGALSLCATKLRESGGAMKLLNPNSAKLESSIFVKLETGFAVFTDQQEAIDSFFPGRTLPHFDILDFVEELKKHPTADVAS
jgi:MFS superfamily sulfate permease-like transporter